MIILACCLTEARQEMAQYIFTMQGVGKVVPPKRVILRDISLSFFPGAKIGVLGLNGAGKSTVLRIMAGIDKDIDGEARPQSGIRVGYLPQEPQLEPSSDVRSDRPGRRQRNLQAPRGIQPHQRPLRGAPGGG